MRLYKSKMEGTKTSYASKRSLDGVEVKRDGTNAAQPTRTCLAGKFERIKRIRCAGTVQIGMKAVIPLQWLNIYNTYFRG